MIRILLILMIGVFFALPPQANAQFSSLGEDVPTICPIPEKSSDRICEINLCIRTGFTGNGCGAAFSEFVCRLSPFCGGSPIPLPDECLCTWIPQVLITPQKLGLPSNISLATFEREAQARISALRNEAGNRVSSLGNLSTCTPKKIRLKGKDDKCMINTGFSMVEVDKDRKSRKNKIYELTITNIPFSRDEPISETLIEFRKNKPTFCQTKLGGVVTSRSQDCANAEQQFPPTIADDEDDDFFGDDLEVDRDDADFNEDDFFDDFPGSRPDFDIPETVLCDGCVLQ